MKKKRIPPEIDEMLWATAESSEERVVQEFERRYPQYRAELARRRAMLEALRKARPREFPTRRVSPLARDRTPPRISLLRFWWVPVAAVFLVGVAVASYWLTKGIIPSPASQAPEREALSLPSVSPSPSEKREEMQPVPQAPRNAQAPGSVPRPFTPAPDAPRVVLPLKGMSLHRALEEVSRQAKITVTIMPDVPEMTLDLGSLLNPPPPSGEVSLPLEEMILLLEKVAPIRFLDNGPEGYVVLPLEKVQNVPSAGEKESSQGSPVGSEGSMERSS